MIQDVPDRLDTTLEALAALSPRVGKALAVIGRDVRARRDERAREAIDSALDEAGADGEALAAHLGEDERLADLFAHAVEAAQRTRLQAKRRMLGRVAARAAYEHVIVDHAEFIVDALVQLDEPHIAALTRLRLLEHEVAASGKDPDRLGIEADRWPEPTPVTARLEAVGCIKHPETYAGLGGSWKLTEFGRELLAELDAPDHQ